MPLLEGFLWHDEVFVAEALILFRGWEVVAILRILILKRIIGVNLPFLPIIMFRCWFDGGIGVFGVLRSVNVSGAGIAVFSVTRF